MSDKPEAVPCDGAASVPRPRRCANAPMPPLMMPIVMMVIYLLTQPTSFSTPPFPRDWRVSYGNNSTNSGTTPATSPVTDNGITDWNDIVPSTKLNWVPCFRNLGPLLCSRLTVARDPFRPLGESASHPKVHIAVVLRPGVGHGPDTGNYSVSPLVLNPGGPGGSGTNIAIVAGGSLQAAVAPELDVLGFDPRGIGATWPQADCFRQGSPDEPMQDDERTGILLRRMQWVMQIARMQLPGEKPGALERTVTDAKAVNMMCAEKDEKDSIFRYVGTPHVAQDMLSIVKAWDEWRDGLPGMKEEDESRGEGQTALSTKGKLVYWGFSYGTMLGSTFASMFPKSVGRLILDGNVDSDMYFDDSFKYAIRDTDKVLDSFFEYCFAAKDACALWRKGDTTSDLIQARFGEVLRRLEEEPLIVIPTDARVPIIITPTVIKSLAFSSMYFPGLQFPSLALVVNLLYLGVELGPLLHYPDLYGMCGPAPKLQMYPEDSPVAIGCVDWQGVRNLTMPEYKKLLADEQKLSWFGDVFTVVHTRCAGYAITPHDPPAMDWNKFPRGRLNESTAIRTAYPLLFLSTTHDPVTPLRQALLMSTRFSNSSIVEQRSEGHCSLSSLSFCTVRHVKAYLAEGKLPKQPRLDEGGDNGEMLTGEWEQCEADEQPWKPYRPPMVSNGDSALRLREEAAMVKAVEAVRKTARDEGWWDFQQNRQYGEEVTPLQNLMKMDYGDFEQLLRTSRAKSTEFYSVLRHGREKQKILGNNEL